MGLFNFKRTNSLVRLEALVRVSFASLTPTGHPGHNLNKSESAFVKPMRSKPMPWLHNFACKSKMSLFGSRSDLAYKTSGFVRLQKLRFCTQIEGLQIVDLQLRCCYATPLGYKSFAFVSVALQIVDLQLRCCYATPQFASTASLANLRFAYKPVAATLTLALLKLA